MKITDIEIKSYLLPLDPPFNAAWDFKPRKQFCATVVQVHTDEGITGIGSGDLMLGFQGMNIFFRGMIRLILNATIRFWTTLIFIMAVAGH